MTDGLLLTEIAPGIDLRAQVLELMDFPPSLPPDGPRLMRAPVFR